jgi:predicted permease
VFVRFRNLIRNFLDGTRRDEDLDAEVREYAEMLAEEKMRAGAKPDEARRAARIDLGGIEQVKEEVRAVSAGAWLDSLLQDVRYGARLLRKSPGFTAVAVLTLGIGIGANAAIFSAVNTVLLRSLPVEDSARVVVSVAMREGYDPFGTSLLEYAAFRARNHSFVRSGLALERSFNLIGREEPERVQGAAVQADYVATLGVQPILGQTITEKENRPGGQAVALLGYGLWMRRFGGDPHAIGRAIDLDGRSTTVIGILPPMFDYPHGAQIWIPLQTQSAGLPLADLAAHTYDMVARLRPGVSVEQADAESRRIARDLETEYPAVRRGWSVKVIPMRRELLRDLPGRVEKSLLALLGAVGFLLLICSANVAGLLMARGVAREREIAVRRALGAGWSRIIRQLLTESLLIAMLGGLAGLALAYLMLPLLSSLNPVETTAFTDVLRGLHVDGRVLVFATAVTFVAGVMSGVLPALKTVSVKDLMPLIQKGTQRSGSGNASRRMLGSLVVAEIAIAVALLAGGALMIQSFRRLQHGELGFRPMAC